MAGVDIDGVGRDGYGMLAADGSCIEADARPMPGAPDGVADGTDGWRSGVWRETAGLLSGVTAPTEIRTIAPHTLHRALTPFGGTFAGSTRKTDRQS